MITVRKMIQIALHVSDVVVRCLKEEDEVKIPHTMLLTSNVNIHANICLSLYPSLPIARYFSLFVV